MPEQCLQLRMLINIATADCCIGSSLKPSMLVAGNWKWIIPPVAAHTSKCYLGLNKSVPPLLVFPVLAVQTSTAYPFEAILMETLTSKVQLYDEGLALGIKPSP